MSDNFLKITPSRVDFVPDPECVQRTASLLKSLLPNAKEVAFRHWSGVQFIDQGCFFERLFCPQCGSEVDLDWWHERMSEKWSEGSKCFKSLDIKTPCCGCETTLNDLRYDWPAAFGRCAVEVMNPGRDINHEEIEQIEATIGCPVRKVLARY